MAGSVAARRLPYPNYPTPGGDGASVLSSPSHTNSLNWNMEERVILDKLYSDDENKISEAIQELRRSHRRHGALVYDEPVAIFGALSNLLQNGATWDIKHQCLQFIQEAIPTLESNIDFCMLHVLPQLARGMGDPNIAIRKVVIQTLHVYMKHTSDMQQALNAIVKHGIENNDISIQQQVCITLPMLLTPEFSQENFYGIVQSLTKKLLQPNINKDGARMSLEKVRNLVGETQYYQYVSNLAAPLKKFYYKETGEVEPENLPNTNSRNGSYSQSTHNTHTPRPTGNGGVIHIQQRMAPTGLEFGFVPSHIMDRIHDQTNFKVRGQAVEHLKQELNNLPDSRVLLPHVLKFISFLNNLLDDNNFQITTVTLDILGILVSTLDQDIAPFLRPMIAALTKGMGDNKIVMRQANLKVVVKLMQTLTPKPVLTVISQNLSHRLSRVRQETLNIIIASLLMFPSYNFDLGELCKTIAPTLVDPKRQVRQASLECFATLAQAMGQGKLASLVQAVDSVELSCDGEGVMAAVQARLSRRQLPRLNNEGLVDYATPAPGSAASARGHGYASQGADIDWILAASSGPGSSARSRSDPMELESVNSSARSTPTESTPRRFLSAGKGKSKFPWESEEKVSSRKGTNNHSPPLRGNNTWGHEDTNDTGNKRTSYQGLRQLRHGAGSRDHSPDQGSYRLIHKKKLEYKRGSPDPQVPYSVYRAKAQDGQKRPEDQGVRSSFSNSWPESRMFDEAGKSNKRVLDPISVKDMESSPIPMKATLARGHSSRKKVPPIIPDRGGPRDDDMYVESARDSVLDGYIDEYDYAEDYNMERSLRPIRNSARKKAEKIFRESQYSRSPSPPSYDGLDESGIFSQGSMPKSEDGLNNKKKGSKKGNPIQTKPQLARKGSQHSPKHDDSTGSGHQETYQPHGGVTFRENPSSDVAIVGRGYSDDVDHSKVQPRAAKRKVSKGFQGLTSPSGSAINPYAWEDDSVPEGVIGKGMFDTSTGSDQHNHTSPTDRRDRRNSKQELEPRNLPKGIVGVSVRQSSVDKLNYSDDFDSSESDSESDEAIDDDVSIISISKTTREKAAQKQQQKQQEVERQRVEEEKLRKEEEQERKRQEEDRRARERKVREEARKAREEKDRQKDEEVRKAKEEERKVKEKQRQLEKLRRVSGPIDTHDLDMGISVSSTGGSPASVKNPVNDSSPVSTTNKPPSGRPSPASTPQNNRKLVPNGTSSFDKKPSPAHEVSPSSSRSPGEIEKHDDLKPMQGNPDTALRQALALIAKEEWEDKCSGLTTIRQLVVHDQQTVLAHLHPVIAAVNKEIKNLRSQVSRLAIVCMGDMFLYLKKCMETDLDVTTKVLLAKTGESNVFIRTDTERALTNMVECINPQRALAALVAGGASHKNTAVRKSCAQLLVIVVERMGPGRVLSGVKDITERVLPTAAQFLLDGSPETRYNGQKILHMLMSHQDFDKMMTKNVPASTLRNVQDKIDSLKRKGLGDPPSETQSARTRRSGQGSRSNSSSRGNSAQSGADGIPAVTPVSSNVLKRNTSRTDEASMENIKSMIAMMAANDWKERLSGIQRFRDMVDSNPVIVGNNVVKIFDKFTPCLRDSNSKVNLLALQTMVEVTPVLKDYMGNVTNLAIQTVTANLSSKNKEIHDTASEVLDAFMDNLDAALLLQPFCNQAQAGNTRIKPDMIERVSYLARKVYSKKSKQVMLHALPLLWHLLGASSGSSSAAAANGVIRNATKILAQTLYSLMQQQLVEQATSNPNVSPKHIQQLQDMLDL